MQENQNQEQGAPVLFDLGSIFTSEKLENEGVWCPFPQGAEALVARVGNEKYRSLLRKKWKASRAVLEQEDDFAANMSEDLMIEVYAETILLDLRGFALNGKPLGSYTPELGRKLLHQRAFRERIKAYAEDEANFREKKEAEAVKS